MNLSPLESDILRGLRHGPLDHWQLAADLAAAPFMVAASLNKLRRDSLVRYHEQQLMWEITWDGRRVADTPNLLETLS